MQRTTVLLRPRSGRMLRWLCALAGASALWTHNVAHAQFQHLYGSGNSERGAAVVQVSDGGYMAVGQHTDPSTSNTSAYAVRTDASGTIIWDQVLTFDRGWSVSFTDVKQCGNGDFVIAGYAAIQQSCTQGCTRAVVMRIDPNGIIKWQRSIGDQNLQYVASAVVETQFGNGSTTNAGDIAVAGYTLDYNSQSYDGLMMRLTADGDIIWKKEYHDGAANVAGTTTLYGIDEARVGPHQGDIVAAGQIWPNGLADVLVMRVAGADGTVGASPQGIARFSGPNNDHSFSIAEIRDGSYAGDLVVTGTSTSRLPYHSYEMLMVETRPDPCDAAGQRADQFLGDNFTASEIGFCVREITDPALYANPGNVIVTGIGEGGGIPNGQAILVECQAGSMTPVNTFFNTYGGAGREEGDGVAECTSALGTPGFVLTGSSTTSSNGLYLVRTDAAHATPCDQGTIANNPAAAGLAHYCLSLTLSTPPADIICGIQVLETEWGNDICQLTAIPPKLNHGALTQDDEEIPANVESFPNPARSGDEITLDYAVGASGHATVAVTDVAGREISSSVIDGAGETPVHLSTTGWAPGLYIIRITSRAGTRTARVTLLPR